MSSLEGEGGKGDEIRGKMWVEEKRGKEGREKKREKGENGN